MSLRLPRARTRHTTPSTLMFHAYPSFASAASASAPSLRPADRSTSRRQTAFAKVELCELFRLAILREYTNFARRGVEEHLNVSQALEAATLNSTSIDQQKQARTDIPSRSSAHGERGKWCVSAAARGLVECPCRRHTSHCAAVCRHCA